MHHILLIILFTGFFSSLCAQTKTTDERLFDYINNSFLIEQIEYDSTLAHEFLTKIGQHFAKTKDCKFQNICKNTDYGDLIKTDELYNCVMNNDLNNGFVLTSIIAAEKFENNELTDSLMFDAVEKDFEQQLQDPLSIIDEYLYYFPKGSSHILKCNMSTEMVSFDPETFEEYWHYKEKPYYVAFYFAYQ